MLIFVALFDFALMQACFRNHVFYSWDLSLPLCWDGCIRHRKVEIYEWQVKIKILSRWLIIYPTREWFLFQHFQDPFKCWYVNSGQEKNIMDNWYCLTQTKTVIAWNYGRSCVTKSMAYYFIFALAPFRYYLLNVLLQVGNFWEPFIKILYLVISKQIQSFLKALHFTIIWLIC